MPSDVQLKALAEAHLSVRRLDQLGGLLDRMALRHRDFGVAVSALLRRPHYLEDIKEVVSVLHWLRTC
jgi:hypothetical protein